MKHLKQQGGFTLIEILGTIALISIGFVAILQVFAASDKLSRQSHNLTAANNFAQSQLDYYRSLGYDALTTSVTDVTSSMPSSIPGTVASCASGAAKSACVEILKGTAITGVDTTGIQGEHSDVAIGSDGIPVISYRDGSALDLKVAKCANSACTGSSTITSVDTTGNIGIDTSIAIGTDGFPVISYQDGNADLRVAKCVNAACTGSSTITTVDSVGNVGFWTSIAIGTDGYPVVSYHDSSSTDLKVAKCVNAACTGSSTVTAVDTAGAGDHTSIAIGTDGLPVIAYHDGTLQDLKVAKCVNAACTGSSTITSVDSAIIESDVISLAIGSDGYPVISYIGDDGAGKRSLWVAKCVNAACTGSSTKATLYPGVSGSGAFSSIAIGGDGFPIIAYGGEATTYGLLVAKCSDLACSSNVVTTNVTSDNLSAAYTSVAVAADGLPIISFFHGGGDLRAAKCVNISCSRVVNNAFVSVVVRYWEGNRTKTIRQSTYVTKSGLGT